MGEGLFGDTDKEQAGKVRYHWQLSETNERYTPPEYTMMAHKVMGAIDLDPASNALCNLYIAAHKYYGIEDDGLSKDWGGRVWLNPPYGKTGNRSNVDIWASKLCREIESGRVTEAIFLCGSRHLNLSAVQFLTGIHWHRETPDAKAKGRPIPSATLFPWKRIKFLSIPNNKIGTASDLDSLTVKSAPPGNNALIYVGRNVGSFAAHAKMLGRVMVPFGMLEYPTEMTDAVFGYWDQGASFEVDKMVQGRLTE